MKMRNYSLYSLMWKVISLGWKLGCLGGSFPPAPPNPENILFSSIYTAKVEGLLSVSPVGCLAVVK